MTSAKEPPPGDLQPDALHVWYQATDAVGEEALERATAMLSSEERARRDTFAHAHDRRDFAIAHALLRRTLTLYGRRPSATWRFETVLSRKPALPPDDPSRLSFSISHTRGMVACAVALNTDVGIDVEKVDRTLDGLEIAEHHFAPAEIEALATLEGRARAERFIELWTLREACIKTIGVHAPKQVAFDFSTEQRIVFKPASGELAAPWHFELFAPAPDYRIAVARRSFSRWGCRVEARTEAKPNATLAPIRASQSQSDFRIDGTDHHHKTG